MRTLVISDLHLGERLHHGVLHQPAPLRRLLESLESIERLVLLGDVVELRGRRPEQAMRAAGPVLRALGERLGDGREVLLVPGNHDRLLIERWLDSRRDGELTPASAVPLDATPALAEIASRLAPARVHVSYPGAWLSERVWATHGHYLDRHLLPESAFGVARDILGLGRIPRDGATALDYEHGRRPSSAPVSGWLPRPVAALIDDVAELIRASTMPQIPRLLHPRFAPVTSMLLGAQMKGASIPALARVVHRLGVDAPYVLFGHVHRLGPLAGDRPAQWQWPGGVPLIWNTGSWVYEPRLVHRAAPPHPYWPGGAVLLEPDQPPEAIGLLDDLAAGQLH